MWEGRLCRAEQRLGRDETGEGSLFPRRRFPFRPPPGVAMCDFVVMFQHMLTHPLVHSNLDRTSVSVPDSLGLNQLGTSTSVLATLECMI